MGDHRPTTDQTDRSTTDRPAVDADLDRAVRRTGRVRTGFYVVVLLVALTGQVTGAVERLHLVWYFAALAVGALEMGGVVVLSNADVRRRLGERAVASRILSAGIAAFAVAFNWASHVDHLLGGFYAGMSALGYLVWLMATENSRRDRLRAIGQLPPTAPAYPAAQWARHPWLTRRARHLALVDPTLGLYGSLAVAASAVRTERRQAAIAAILRRQIRASADPASAEIAVTVFDLDEIAARLAARADYDALTDLIAVGLAPDRLLRRLDEPDQSAVDRVPADADGPADQPASSRPCAARPTNHRPANPKPTIPGPTEAADRPRLHVVGRPAAVANAAELRRMYGDNLPTVERQIRTRTGWSKERVEKAVAAYRAGADLEPADEDKRERGDALTA
jgi:hypothetical protein